MSKKTRLRRAISRRINADNALLRTEWREVSDERACLAHSLSNMRWENEFYFQRLRRAEESARDNDFRRQKEYDCLREKCDWLEQALSDISKAYGDLVRRYGDTKRHRQSVSA